MRFSGMDMKDRNMLFATSKPIRICIRGLQLPVVPVQPEPIVDPTFVHVMARITNYGVDIGLFYPSYAEYNFFRRELLRPRFLNGETLVTILQEISTPQGVGGSRLGQEIRELHATMMAGRWHQMIPAPGWGPHPRNIESPLDLFSIPLEFFFSFTILSLSILLALGLFLVILRWKNDRLFLFAAILSICASSPKKISIYNEEMIVARCFIGFLIFSRKSLGKTFKETLDGRIESIQEELQQFFNPNEVIPEESNEQQRNLRISLRISGTVVESLPTARCAPKCEKTVQALLCRNLNVKSATLLNATSSRRIRLQDDIVTGFHFSVSERFVSGSTFKASTVEQIREAFGPIDLIREGLIVLRMAG